MTYTFQSQFIIEKIRAVIQEGAEARTMEENLQDYFPWPVQYLSDTVHAHWFLVAGLSSAYQANNQDWSSQV